MNLLDDTLNNFCNALDVQMGYSMNQFYIDRIAGRFYLKKSISEFYYPENPGDYEIIFDAFNEAFMIRYLESVIKLHQSI